MNFHSVYAKHKHIPSTSGKYSTERRALKLEKMIDLFFFLLLSLVRFSTFFFNHMNQMVFRLSLRNNQFMGEKLRVKQISTVKINFGHLEVLFIVLFSHYILSSNLLVILSFFTSHRVCVCVFVRKTICAQPTKLGNLFAT